MLRGRGDIYIIILSTYELPAGAADKKNHDNSLSKDIVEYSILEAPIFKTN